MRRCLKPALHRVAAAALVWGLAFGAAWGASEDPDWPCIQRKVPHVSAGMVWAGPPVDETDAAWRADPEVRELAAKLAARTTDLEDATAAVAPFAQGLGADKARRLSLLFTGILVTVNAERDAIVQGIARYARRQQALAHKIEQAGAQLNALPADGAGRAELAEQIQWDTRIFEEREHSLRYVCEQPVLLEQRLFALAREIMNHLD